MIQDFPLTTPIQLRTTDIDMYMHVNNTRYLDYFDLGKAQYFASASHGQWKLEKFLTVIANINCSFIRSVHYKDTVQVLTRCESIGGKSFVMHQILTNPERSETYAECRTIMVCVDKNTGESVRVPDSWRKAFSNFEGRQLDAKA